MKADYEIKMRWAISEHIWKQIKAQTCLSTYTIAEDKDCQSGKLWEMYKLEACKSGNEAFKMSLTEQCKLDTTAMQTELDTFCSSNEDVAAMLKEYDKTKEDMLKTFTAEYFDHLLAVLKEKMIIDEKQVALTNPQATSIIAHETLMNSGEYQSFLSWWRFWSMGIHYWRVKQYKTYVYIAGGVLLVLLLLGKGGGGGSVQQQVVVVRR